MKKLFALIATLCFVGSVVAQGTVKPLPDGSFEEWKTGTNYNGDKYDELANPFWQTLNALSSLPPEMGTGPIVVFKEQGKTGFCPKMKSDKLTLGEKTIFLPGLVGALTLIIEKQTADFGRPYTSRPKSLQGFYKYSPVDGDSASIFTELYAKNPNTGERVIIGKAEQRIYKEAKEWTPITMNIRYIAEGNPDSATVLFVSSAAYNFKDLFTCKGSIGSTLWVDDFVFEGQIVANEKPNTLSLKVYPNPSNGTFSVIVPEKASVHIYSPAGTFLEKIEMQAGTTELSLPKSGVYLLRATSGDKTAVERLIVR